MKPVYKVSVATGTFFSFTSTLQKSSVPKSQKSNILKCQNFLAIVENNDNHVSSKTNGRERNLLSLVAELLPLFALPLSRNKEFFMNKMRNVVSSPPPLSTDLISF
jgi:hypothetical protein